MRAAQGIWYENRFEDAADEAVFGDFGFHDAAPEGEGKAGDPAGMPAHVFGRFGRGLCVSASVCVCMGGVRVAFACAD